MVSKEVLSPLVTLRKCARLFSGLDLLVVECAKRCWYSGFLADGSMTAAEERFGENWVTLFPEGGRVRTKILHWRRERIERNAEFWVGETDWRI